MADASGAFGAPPPGAPHEVAQDLSPELVQSQIAKARANERPLAPFSPGGVAPSVPPLTPTQVAAPGGRPPEVSASVAPPQIVLTDAPQTLEEAAVQRARAESNQPAASNSDSPSRGIPRPIADPGKQITGGWGAALEAQYFPLDGLELRVLTERLLEQLKAQIQNDLHFTPAMCYPRIAVRLVLEVTGFNVADSFSIQKGVAHDKTAEDVAKAIGQPLSLALQEVAREFNEHDEPIDPPDRMRDALGLPKPRKQAIDAGGGRQIVDVVPTLEGSF